MDIRAVRDSAAQFEASASLIAAALASHLSQFRFDGDCAGQAYGESGETVRAAVQGVVDGLRRWSRASVVVGAQLRETSERYRVADESSSAGLR